MAFMAEQFRSSIGEYEARDAVRLGSLATGGIQPGEGQPHAAEVLRVLGTGNFHTASFGDLPAQCIDGQPGDDSLWPNTAGGSVLTTMVVVDLTQPLSQDARSEQIASLSAPRDMMAAFGRTLAVFQEKGLPIGGHTDDHAHGEASGCGANDKLPEIYKKLAEQTDGIRRIVQELGVTVDDTTHRLISANVRASHQGWQSRQALEKLQQSSGAVVPTLTGGHNEVAIVINTQPGTTLDRALLASEFGAQHQAFGVDAWAIKNLAEAVSDNDEQTDQLYAAALYYNVATALVLCGPDMPVVVL